MASLTLVSGVPRAGKSSLCDAIEAADVGFTHVPLDRYVLPVPASRTFHEWIATPACIAWDLVWAHLAVLASGTPCYSPRPAWERGWRDWECAGGPLAHGPGRRMLPAGTAYLLAGTHAFGCPLPRVTLRVFVRTPLVVVAERLTGQRVARRAARALVRSGLAPNTAAVLREYRRADVIIDGTADRDARVQHFLHAYTKRDQCRSLPAAVLAGGVEQDVAADKAAPASSRKRAPSVPPCS